MRRIAVVWVTTLALLAAQVGNAGDAGAIPPGPTGPEARFAVVGDYGSGLPAEAAVAALIDGLDPDFIVTTGDNVYQLAGAGPVDFDELVGQYYSAYIGAYSGAYGPGSPTNRFFPATGNHDYTDPPGGISDYLDYFQLPGAGIPTLGTSGSELHYDFVQGPVHFFMLDSRAILGSSAEAAAEAAWLQSGLAASVTPWQAVVLHHPPYSSGSTHGSSPALQWDFADWGADVVFAGHEHLYERLEVDGIPYLISGAGGRSLYGFGPPLPETRATYSADYGTLIVDACPTGLTMTFHALGGAAIDSTDVGDGCTLIDQRTYHIGNSLTWDMQPPGLEALAEQRGHRLDTGHHIRCASSLVGIWNNPTDTCVSPAPQYGPFLDALPTHAWDAVTIQPYPGGGSTLLDDEIVILDLIAAAQANPANLSTRFYVYTGWPSLNGFGSWSDLVADLDSTPTTHARQYHEHLIARVRAATSADVFIVPVGDVLADLDQRLQAGAVPGYSGIADLYRDDVHLTFDVGRFVAGLTTHATLYREDPAGLVKPDGHYGADPAPFTPALYAAIYQSVWTTVAGDPLAGVTPEAVVVSGMVAGVTDEWVGVDHGGSFVDPVVVAGPASWNGYDPGVVEVRSVTSTGFEVRFREWEYLDGPHPKAEEVSFVVVERGVSVLPSGAMIEAGTSAVSGSAGPVGFSGGFGSIPVVIGTVLADTDPVPVVAPRLGDVTTAGFVARLQEQEALGGAHGPESVNWMAWSPGSGTGGVDGFMWETQTVSATDAFTTVTVTGTYGKACVVADMNTFNGPDTSTVRYADLTTTSIDLQVDEETSLDGETVHTTETLAVLILDCEPPND